MGKLNIFEISFSNLTGVYYAGQIVEGHITVELNEPMNMKGIKTNFKGEAEVSWAESREEGDGDDRHTVTDTYSASEKYFDQDIPLFGNFSKHGSESQELSAGRHVFPFRYQLPFKLPSSFEDSVGHVRYVVSGKIDKPGKDHKTKRPFTIIGILDLNQHPRASQKLQATKEKHLCCLCCKSGPIQATVHIERAGYVPGEAVKIYAEISNGTSRKMDKSYVNLVMLTTFHSTSTSRTDCKEVAKVARPAIPAHSEDSWSGEALIIPPLPPSFLEGCKIIDIKYVLKLNVDPSGFGLDLEIPLELIIGTIPLKSVMERNPPLPPPPIAFDTMYQWDTTPSARPQETFYAPPPGNPPNCPPPTYMESVTGRFDIHDKDDNEYVKGQLKYAPVYTYYNWGNTHGGLPS